MSDYPQHTKDPLYFARHKNEPLVDRFWAKVERGEGRDACWEWTGSMGGGERQYVRLQLGDSTSGKLKILDGRAIAWELMTGEPKPAKHRWATTCDNSICVRGSHLRLIPYGEKPRDFRLKKATEMRELGYTLEQIGTVFGVTRERIRQIIGNRWPNEVPRSRPPQTEIVSNLHHALERHVTVNLEPVYVEREAE